METHEDQEFKELTVHYATSPDDNYRHGEESDEKFNGISSQV